MGCPCGSQQSYEQCCQLIHQDPKSVATAEALMRARYSAFVKANIDFIGATHIPGTEDFDPAEAKDWAENSIWQGLEIVKSHKGSAADDKGTVEFKAKYKDTQDKQYVHHEIAEFKKVNGQWYYDQGQIVGLGPLKRSAPKVGRNDPCPCGSGKKFKKCCGN